MRPKNCVFLYGTLTLDAMIPTWHTCCNPSSPSDIASVPMSTFVSPLMNASLFASFSSGVCLPVYGRPSRSIAALFANFDDEVRMMTGSPGWSRMIALISSIFALGAPGSNATVCPGLSSPVSLSLRITSTGRNMPSASSLRRIESVMGISTTRMSPSISAAMSCASLSYSFRCAGSMSTQRFSGTGFSIGDCSAA